MEDPTYASSVPIALLPRTKTVEFDIEEKTFEVERYPLPFAVICI